MRRYGDFPERRNAQGQMLCKWCAGIVPKGRMFFCNKECAFEVQIRRDASFLRIQVRQRDHGVCAECKMDTQKLKRILGFMRKSYAVLTGHDPMWANEYWFSREMERLYGYKPWQRVKESCLWQADHIIEVVDGGEPYLKNIQTLCVPCHKEKTKQWHAERARSRRDTNRALLPEVRMNATP